MSLDWIATIVNMLILASSLLYVRRGRRAEVRVKEEEAEKAEISNADAMVDLVKKTNEIVVNTLKQENEKFRKSIAKLEKAINNINRCAYRDNCPVLDGMQNECAITRKNLYNQDGQHISEGNDQRHSNKN